MRAVCRKRKYNKATLVSADSDTGVGETILEKKTYEAEEMDFSLLLEEMNCST